MTRVVNLDALRAAREEVLGGNPIAVMGGREFKLVCEMPIDAAVAYTKMLNSDTPAGEDIDAAREFVRLMLADPTELADFFAVGPSWPDLSNILSAYGPSGESSASQPSPPKGGKRSRPTSPRTTKST